MADPIAAHPAGDAQVQGSLILDAALELGEQQGWDAVHLHDVARALGLTLGDIRLHYPQKDALAEAWFDRADVSLLAGPQAQGWRLLSARRRLHASLSAWLDALAPHKRLTAEMLRYKLKPEHLHLQALGLARVSRTVQWWREAAWLPSTGWRREMEEAALTAVYLSTVARWLADDSPGAERTKDWLYRQLGFAERVALRLALRE